MIDRQPRFIFVDEGERRAADATAFAAQSFDDRADEMRLSGASWPINATTAPGKSNAASRCPKAVVAARSGASNVQIADIGMDGYFFAALAALCSRSVLYRK